MWRLAVLCCMARSLSLAAGSPDDVLDERGLEGIPEGWFQVPEAFMCQGLASERDFGECGDDVPSTCDTTCVPQDCVWSAWNSWTADAACTGLQRRHREILEQANDCPASKQCHGAWESTRQNLLMDEWSACSHQPIDCVLGDWGEWAACSGTAVGVQTRPRNIITQPMHQGKICEGELSQVRDCGAHKVTDCEFEPWEAWGECSKTCGIDGTRKRARHIKVYPSLDGKACNGALYENMHCPHLPSCDESIDCHLGDWQRIDCGTSGLLDDMVGHVQGVRSREITTEQAGDGKHCSGVVQELTNDCPRDETKDCTLSQWGSWQPCDRECGGGQTFRLRHVIKDADDCGACPAAETKQTKACNVESCFTPDPDKDCKLTSWEDWGECSAKCGTGVRFRERSVDTPASSGGIGCEGELKKVEACEGTVCESVDCKWTDWKDWGACTRTCGGGTKRRTREIQDAPSEGGKACEAHDKEEVFPCSTQSCDAACRDGEWGLWTDWSSCAVSCGKGYRVRSRDVSQQPNNCGKPAAGKSEDYGLCADLPPCEATEDCALSAWGDWSDCSTSCHGVRERSREISQLAKGPEGKQCESASLKDLQPCNPGLKSPDSMELDKVPEGCGEGITVRDCRMSQWSDWEACPVSCGSAQTRRTRSIMVPALHGGARCEGSLAEAAPCVKDSCPGDVCQDCLWEEWSDWDGCNACGGQKTRHRSIKKHPNHCGKLCDAGSAKEVGECPVAETCNQQRWCAWGEWAEVSGCDRPCGGSKQRQRSLAVQENQPANPFFLMRPGNVCAGSHVEAVRCPDEFECSHKCTPETTTECTWSDWSAWSAPACSGLCERRRTITQANNECGEPCAGAYVDTQRCESNCTKDSDCILSEWHEWSACTPDSVQSDRVRSIIRYPLNSGQSCKDDIRETRPCANAPIDMPRDCKLVDWSPWSACSKSCGGGFALRHRELAFHALSGGEACALSPVQELKECNTGCCSGTDCELTAWSDWSGCKEGSQRFRTREVAQIAEGDGMPCSGSLRETAECESEYQECKMSDWIPWDECSATCGAGQVREQRKRLQEPKGGAPACEEILIRSSPCMVKPCDRGNDCQLSDWTSWSQCSALCGPGQKSRSRDILVPPSGHGRACNGTLMSLLPCTIKPCSPRDCEWKAWTDWSGCSKTCGLAVKQRQRSLLHPATQGGKPCSEGTMIHAMSCPYIQCGVKKACVDGIWDSWSDWSVCSASCLGGLQQRTRGVQQRPNRCGKILVGPRTEQRVCNTQKLCTTAIDCEFSEWNAWTQHCILWNVDTCHGYLTRERSIKRIAHGIGAPCTGNTRESKPCWDETAFPEGCPKADTKQDCVMSDWASWGDCDVNQHAHRNRTVVMHAENGGNDCPRSIAELRPCSKKDRATSRKDDALQEASVAVEEALKLQDLPPNAAAELELSEEILPRMFRIHEGVAEHTKVEVCERGQNCAEPGNYEEGETYGYNNEAQTASLRFKDGRPDTKIKYIHAADAWVTEEGRVLLVRIRNRENGLDVDCAWGEWHDWDQCRCETDQKMRVRRVMRHQRFNGKKCEDSDSYETEPCAVNECAGKGPKKFWCRKAAWTDWSACSVTCGPGKRWRTRSIGPASMAEIQARHVDQLYDRDTLKDHLQKLRSDFSARELGHTQSLLVAFSSGAFGVVVLLAAERLYRSRAALRVGGQIADVAALGGNQALLSE